MKTIVRFGWLAPVLALGIGMRAAAQETASGKVLILTNDRVLEGDIERVGGRFRIRRGIGETLIAAERGKRLCADWSEALAYVRGQANLGDADERLRLARWCHQNGLKDDAQIEARAAVEMRPAHAETKQLLRMLERAVAPVAVQPTPNVVKAAAVQPQLDLSADALALFTTRVQPILMNACASCHAGGQGGDFHLLRPGDGSARIVIQKNLAAAVAQLKLDNPVASPLVVKAVSAHGAMTQPPLRDRRAVPAQTLQQWAEQVAANNPHLRPAPASATASRFGPDSAGPSSPSAASPAVVSTPVVSRAVTRPDGEFLPPALISVQQALRAQMNPLQQLPAAPGKVPLLATDPNDLYSPAAFNNHTPPRK